MSSMIRTAFPAFLLLAGLAGLAAAQPAFDLPRQSPQAILTQDFGYATVTVDYSRPAVNGRVIWGGVVPYDRVWRAGANEPTTVEFTRDVTVNGQRLTAGTYALFMLPEKMGGKDRWIFIFSRNTKGWGAYGYDAKDDALRVTVVPEKTGKTGHKERLEFGFENITDGGAHLTLHWEQLKGTIALTAEFLETAKANIAEGIPNIKPEDPYSWLNAARFYWVHNIDRKQALEWVDKSIAVRPLFNNLWAKAEWLAAEGRCKEALDAAGLAIMEAEKDPGLSSQVSALNKARKSFCKGK